MSASLRSPRRTTGALIILSMAILLLWAAAPAPGQPATLVPTGLRVDLPANDVIEPGEFFSVAPSWTNASGSPVTFTGTASNFTGPAGAAYTISHSTADYGTAGPGETTSCFETLALECYSLHASDPGQRPAFHWDATFLEKLSTGETKTWTLHIGRTFADVSPTGPTYRFIETLVHNGITYGCNTKVPPWFCPRDNVTRGQMAVFIIRAIEGPGYVPPQPSSQRFADVPPSSPFYAYIDQLAARGITAGCGSSRYCPTNLVTRGQMSALILKGIEGASYNPPPPPSQRFADVPPTDPFYEYIDQMAVRGITAGCSSAPPRYCPRDPVTREQMAVFLTRGFALVLYGP